MSQGTPVLVKSSSNGTGGGESDYDEQQQRMDDEQRMQVEAESCSVVAPSESTAAFGAVAAAAIAMDDVEMQQDDAESSSTVTAAGATIVAAAKRAVTADEDPLALQARMKQMLMAEMAESKRLSKAAENSLLNGAESERTARVRRAQLKAAKQQPSEEMEVNPIEENEEQEQMDVTDLNEDGDQKRGEERSKKRSRGVRHRDSHGKRAGNDRRRMVRQKQYDVT